MPMNLADYHPDWRWISRQIREQADNRCEWCSVANHAIGARDLRGEWHDTADLDGMNSDEGAILFGEYPPVIRIVLTVAHLDHDKDNNDPGNLRCLCQACHNRHDMPHRQKNAALTRMKNRIKSGQMALEVI